jgi:hypothetical protein
MSDAIRVTFSVFVASGYSYGSAPVYSTGYFPYVTVLYRTRSNTTTVLLKLASVV